MIRLSIIIPVPGDAEKLDDTLLSLLENRPEDSEVIVVHSGCYDDPYDLKDEIRIVEVVAGAGLLSCLTVGVAEARGDVVHLLAVGSEVNRGWTSAAVEWFEDAQVGAVSPLVVDDADQVIATGVATGDDGGRIVCGEKETEKIIGPTFRAAFYRHPALETIGGPHPPTGDRLADVDIALSLQEIGYRTVFEPSCRVLSHGHTDVEPASEFREGLFTERLFWRHARTFPAITFRPLAIAWQTLRRLPRPSAIAHLAGRLVGLCDSRGRRHRIRLRAAMNHELSKPSRIDPSRIRRDARHRTNVARTETTTPAVR